MRPHYCDICGDAFDRAQPICRQVGCRARACRACRTADGECRACCEERAKISDTAAFVAILLSGATIGGVRAPRVGDSDG